MLSKAAISFIDALSQYSSNYYRATWISTGLDAGFATAMSIRPKWLKDICSVLFSIYYIIYATEADEKVLCPLCFSNVAIADAIVIVASSFSCCANC